MDLNIRKSGCGVYFISDLHLQHKNILYHSKERMPYVEEYKEVYGIQDDIEAHDRWVIDLWLKTTKRGDHIYVLGDFIMGNREESLKMLNVLKKNGCRIHLIVGNHDKSTEKLNNMYETIDLIKVVTFKKTVFPFIEEENFQCVMCHYPMKSWFNKCRGAAMLYGHVHNNSPWMDDTLDLSFNVGFDGKLSHYGLIPLEELYHLYKEKLNGIPPKEYADWACEQDKEFIR